MAEPGVVIPIEGDASGLQAAIASASASLRSLASTAATAASGGLRALKARTDDAGQAAKKATTATDRYKDAAYALNKAANATGGALTFLTGPLEDVGDLLERGTLKTAGLTIGLAAVAVGMAALAANTIEVATNLKDYTSYMDNETRATLTRTSEAMAGLHEVTTGLRVEYAGATANATTYLTGLMAGLALAVTNKAIPAIESLTGAIGDWHKASLESGDGPLNALTRYVEGLQDAGAEALKWDLLQTQLAAEEKTRADARAKAAGVQITAEAAAREKAREDAKKAAADAEREQREFEGRRITFTEEDLGTAAIIQSTAALTDMAIAMGTVVAETRYLNLEFAAVFNTASDELDALPDKLGRSKEEWRDYFADLEEKAQVWAANARFYSGMVFETATNLSDALTKNERKAARNRAIIQKAAAITEATINTLVAVTKALASANPPVNFVLAGIVGAVGAVNIGLIASKPLVYHRGGMLDPDEERLDRTSAVVLRNESLGIVTSAGRSATTTAVSRLNAGEVTSGDTYLMVDGDVFNTRRVGGPDAGYGRSRG